MIQSFVTKDGQAQSVMYKNAHWTVMIMEYVITDNAYVEKTLQELAVN